MSRSFVNKFRRRALAISASVACLMCAGVLLGAGNATDPPTSPAAVRAQQQYQTTIQKARLEYQRVAVAADKKLIADLDAALKVAMNTKDLKEAERLDAAKAAAQATLADHLGGGQDTSLVGKWDITFSGGGHRTYSFGRDGFVQFVEEGRTGRITGGLLDFHDGKFERITPAGERLLIEHYDSRGALSKGPPLLGIAVRTR